MRTHADVDADLFGKKKDAKKKQPKSVEKKAKKNATAVRPAFTQRLCRIESRVIGVCGMQHEPHALPSIFTHEGKKASATRQDAIHMHPHSLLPSMHMHPHSLLPLYPQASATRQDAMHMHPHSLLPSMHMHPHSLLPLKPSQYVRRYIDTYMHACMHACYMHTYTSTQPLTPLPSSQRTHAHSYTNPSPERDSVPHPPPPAYAHIHARTSGHEGQPSRRLRRKFQPFPSRQY
jgi:hypothetical protein